MTAVPTERVEAQEKAQARPVLVRPDVEQRRRRFRHARALVAALAYAGAAAVVVWIVLPVLREERPAQTGVSVAEPAPAPALSSAPRDLLAMRTLAARAQRGVYVLEAGNARGSAFVAWVQPARQRSFLLTSRAVVAGLLAEGNRTVYVRRGAGFWTGRLFGADRTTGLAVVIVNTAFNAPLWQDDDRPGKLEPGGHAFVVPPGRDTAFGEADLTRAPLGRFALATGFDELYVGAPVVNADGHVGGVVVEATAAAGSTVVPLAEACVRLRRCAYP